MADTESQGLYDPSNRSRAQESVVVGIETVAVLLQSMTSSIKELVKRVEALEQANNDRKTQDEATQSADAKSTDVELKPATTTPTDTAPPTPALATAEGLLQTHVEFRKQVWLEDARKFDWIPVDSEAEKRAASARKPFQYDTDESGKLTFSVFRSAKLYQKLLTLCPPAHDGQVNVSEDKLVFEDVFPLLHCRKGLKLYMESLSNDPANNAVREELAAFEELYEREGHLKNAQQRYDDLLRNQKIDCESLKGLFHRDQLVVFRELRDEWAVARITMVTANDEYNSLGNDVQLELECKAIDFDGKNFRSHLYRKEINVFTGTRSITELPVYPLAYFKDRKELIQLSIESGAHWWKLHQKLKERENSVAVMQYAGYCETFGDDGRDEEDGGKGSQIFSRVIIDPIRFPDRFLQFTEDNQDPFPTNPLAYNGDPEDNPLVLCPERVLVHSLSDNEWYYVAMTRLRKPEWAKNAWSRLVKPSSSSDNTGIADSINRIQLLTEAHKLRNSMPKDESLDNFTGKGKGLTFLLHGPPGVGKTMLAECLSEQHQRPLYRINLGKLIAEYNWESKIDEIFRQAHLWNAILLVDEAEVILAERTQENMHQSAWVAVFLRKIEYFEGVIFLTTNLIHMIDPAFISRVNLGFRIPVLDSETRLEIWRKMLGDLPKSNQTQWLNPKSLEEWAQCNLNGRQIRNVIHSACLLALPPMIGKVTESNIENALQDVVNFTEMIEGEKKDVELKHMSHWS